MATIGSVTKREDGRYEGELRTLSIRAEIAILPVADKASANQPDYRVMSQGIEIGAGWLRKGQTPARSTCRSRSRRRSSVPRRSTPTSGGPRVSPIPTSTR